MKSIAHIVSTGEFSGAEKIVIEICKCLKNDYEFTYICKYGGIIDYLDLKKPIFSKTSNYGHFGRDGFAWEEVKQI